MVIELVETAAHRADIRAWAALSVGGVAANDRIRLVEVERDGLRLKPPGEARALLRGVLRSIRSVVTPLPLPPRLRETARTVYARLAVAAAAARRGRSSEEAGDTLSLLLVPGMFWHGNIATRSRRLAEDGVPLRFVLYDLFPLRHPEWYPSPQSEVFREALGHLVAASERIVTLSQDVARQVVEHYPQVTGRVHVAVPALHAHSPRIKPDQTPAPVSGPFLLALSTIEPRKNHRLILDAWSRVRLDPRAGDAQLVTAGGQGWLADDIEAEIARNGARLRIVRVDQATDSVVEALYRDCVATVHASWEEGFGLPVRESVARGIPTLMSSTIPRDGLPDGSFRTFDPSDVEGLAALMVEAIIARPQRGPVASGPGTGWESVVSALVD